MTNIKMPPPIRSVLHISVNSLARLLRSVISTTFRIIGLSGGALCDSDKKIFYASFPLVYHVL